MSQEALKKNLAKLTINELRLKQRQMFRWLTNQERDIEVARTAETQLREQGRLVETLDDLKLVAEEITRRLQSES